MDNDLHPEDARVILDTQDGRFDIPWMLDSSLARDIWDWKPTRSVSSILDEIADHAEKNPNWRGLTA